MGERRPRRAPRIKEPSKKTKQEQEFLNCRVPGCPNIVSTEVRPETYSGPVFCLIHRDRYAKKR